MTSLISNGLTSPTFLSILRKRKPLQSRPRSWGGQYLYGGDFLNIVRQYCLLGPVEQCIQRLQEYIDAGARNIIFSVSCPSEDRPRHIETIAKEIIPHFRPAK